MAKIQLEEAPEFDVFPEETVIEVLVKVTEVREFEGKNGPWEKLNFEFEVTRVFDPTLKHMEGIKIFGGVPFRLTDHEDNQLRQWVEALLGLQDLGIGFELDTDDLDGRRARAVTGTYTKKGTTQVRHTVEHLLPIDDGMGQIFGSGQAPAEEAPAAPAAVQRDLSQVSDDDVPF
jgi:hypothetical protein